MIHTFTSSSFLYKVNRNRQQYLTAIEKRRAILYCAGITLCIAIVTLIVIIYR